MHDALARLNPRWIQVHGMATAAYFRQPTEELETLKHLAMCDVSALPRLGVKGAGVEAWVQSHGVRAPASIYSHLPLDGGGLIVRTGATEFFLEGGIAGGVVPRLAAEQVLPADVYRFPRQDAALLLSGRRTLDVLAQTCGYNFRAPGAEFIMSRVAGISCSILRQQREGMPLLRIWCDASLGMYLWETLLEIVKETGGATVGLACFFAIAPA